MSIYHKWAHSVGVCADHLHRVSNPFHCKPAIFICACGREWHHVCDEAEGCYYIYVGNSRLVADVTHVTGNN